MLLKLTSNSLCSQGLPGTDPPASTLPVLSLKTCAPTPGSGTEACVFYHRVFSAKHMLVLHTIHRLGTCMHACDLKCSWVCGHRNLLSSWTSGHACGLLRPSELGKGGCRKQSLHRSQPRPPLWPRSSCGLGKLQVNRRKQQWPGALSI